MKVCVCAHDRERKLSTSFHINASTMRWMHAAMDAEEIFDWNMVEVNELCQTSEGERVR